MFHIQEYTNNFFYIIGYAFKRLNMYFKLCFMVYFYYTNLNALCNVYTVQKKIYSVTQNRIFCLILGLTFGNVFLMVSNEGEDNLWLYFAYFLN